VRNGHWPQYSVRLTARTIGNGYEPKMDVAAESAPGEASCCRALPTLAHQARRTG
jgi:hypothetical protein